VGAGTGSITTEIARRMKGAGRLDLWEISPAFCAVLRQRLSKDKFLSRMDGRVRVHEGDIRNLKTPGYYDVIISGLPFNNFKAREVKGFLEHFRTLLKPGGRLAWFEYVAIRRLQFPFVSPARRKELKRIHAVTQLFVRSHQIKKEIIPLNLPPARVLRLQFK
jgi:phospholipid N-methyltransferase